MAWTTPETFTAGQTLPATSMNIISNNLRIGHPVCTSTTRPSSPDDGTMVYESDTKRYMYYDSANSTWRFYTHRPSYIRSQPGAVTWATDGQTFGPYGGTSPGSAGTLTVSVGDVILAGFTAYNTPTSNILHISLWTYANGGRVNVLTGPVSTFQTLFWSANEGGSKSIQQAYQIVAGDIESANTYTRLALYAGNGGVSRSGYITDVWAVNLGRVYA